MMTSTRFAQSTNISLLLLLLGSLLAARPAPSEEPHNGVAVAVLSPSTHATVCGEGVPVRDGVVVHSLQSEYQAGPTEVKVLLPKPLDSAKSYPVLYVLPVEARNEHRYGDGIEEARKLDLANRWQVICVEPTFSHLPWYADHPSDKTIRQESHLLEVVLPFVERTFPARRERAGRWLVGFSKSGWGALSLLLRHPDRFDRAAAWDAPLMKDAPNQFGMEGIFGTRANFAEYQLTTLVARQREQLQRRPRLVLTSYDNFRSHHVAFHEQLVAWNVPHIDRDGPQRKHVWESGWLAEAVELLATLPDSN